MALTWCPNTGPANLPPSFCGWGGESQTRPLNPCTPNGAHLVPHQVTPILTPPDHHPPQSPWSGSSHPHHRCSFCNDWLPESLYLPAPSLRQNTPPKNPIPQQISNKIPESGMQQVLLYYIGKIDGVLVQQVLVLPTKKLIQISVPQSCSSRSILSMTYLGDGPRWPVHTKFVFLARGKGETRDPNNKCWNESRH